MMHLIRIFCAALVLGSVALAGRPTPAPAPAPIHTDGAIGSWAN